MKKLLIAVPAGDYIHAEFVKCLLALTRRLDRDGVEYEVAIHTGSLVYIARDVLACKAINEGFDYVLWLDSDMVFTDDLLEDLQFSGEDFVTGIAVGRREPFCSCLFSDLEDITRIEEYPSNTFQVKGCGFACVLIYTEILRGVWMTYKTCFAPMERYGEDVAFCWRAGQLGFKIWAEPAVKVGHIAHITVYPDDAGRWRRD